MPQQAYIKASNIGAGDRFGRSIDLDGDILIVGAMREDSVAIGVDSNEENDNNAEDSGAAYVFSRDNMGNWAQKSYIKASNTGAGDFFGWSVAINGDTLTVGASNEDSGSMDINNDDLNNDAGNSGAVFVFSTPSDIFADGFEG